jgi:arylsulfatase A-like enzyme
MFNLILAFTLVLLGTLKAVDREVPKLYNVLFIAVDDLRPEMGCYGNSVVKTPNLDRLAKRGIVFNHAYCQQALCSPSRSSIMTGKRPDATKVWDLDTHFRVALPDAVTIPQHFKANGYHCAAAGKIFHVNFEDGRSWSEPHWYPWGSTIDTDPVDWTKRITKQVDDGLPKPPKAAGKANHDEDKPSGDGHGKGQMGPAFEVSALGDDDLADGCTAAHSVRRLHELKAKGEPFFLGVGFMKPHLPFIAPKKYWDLYDPNQIPVPAIDHLPEGVPEFAGHQNNELHAFSNVPAGNPIPADLSKTLRHGYYACISYIDAQIGRLLDALDAEGLADNTVIVLWGDHGYQLGDHGLWHKHTNFEYATRAPLLISVPHQASAGQKCDAAVEFVDVYPTLAEVCGLPIPSGLDGQSLQPFIANPKAPAQKVAISQYPRGKALMGYSVRNERWRFTQWRQLGTGEIKGEELYDEQNDPAETVNLNNKPEHKAVIEELSKHLPAIAVTAPQQSKHQAKSLPEEKVKQRTTQFQSLDANHDGKLSREEFLSKQPDVEAAKPRFDLWDINKDGFLSADEFIYMGAKPN